METSVRMSRTPPDMVERLAACVVRGATHAATISMPSMLPSCDRDSPCLLL
jgi:hypothetical protein